MSASDSTALGDAARGGAKKLTLGALVAATYFMVSGGPYGLEELVQKAGYASTLLILLVTPIVWSLPTGLMVGELAAALPEEGGYYAWVRRGLGPFWGFQEAWLSLVASVFDMAIYPTLFVLYLGRFEPRLASGNAGIGIGLLVIAACAAWNIRGSKAVGDSSIALAIALLAPFGVLVVFALVHRVTLGAPEPTPSHGSSDLVGAALVAMWNYMGWDNASTIAGEVERPQRTYPLAMIVTIVLVVVTYALPIGAAWIAGLDPSDWETGSWVTAASAIGGHSLGVAVVIGGMVCGAGMLNALVLSYSRVPFALAEDGYLPKIFARRHPKTGAPWVAIVACSIAWACCLGIGFERLVELDVVLYGASLLLEFAALVALRIREPKLPRPFKVPGGIAGAVLLGVGPLAMLVLAVVRGDSETVGPVSALVFGAVLIALGPIVYFATARLRKTATP